MRPADGEAAQPLGYTPVQHDRHQTIGSQLEKGKVGDQNELIYRNKNLTMHRHHQEHIVR